MTTFDLRTPCCDTRPQRVEKTFLAQTAATFTTTPDGGIEVDDWNAYRVLDEERWDGHWECQHCTEPVNLEDCKRIPN